MTKETEELLADLGEKIFFKPWCYPNPRRDDGDELCDLLAVFGNQVFIFFEKEISLQNKPNRNLDVSWGRWWRKAIDDQLRGVDGAESYLNSNREIFVDNRRTTPLPINIDRSKMVVHKIVIAHGAEEACKQHSEDNLAGSLMISYGAPEEVPSFHYRMITDKKGNEKIVREESAPPPFLVTIDRENPVHILDSHNLEIILSELDTAADLTAYLEAKADVLKRYQYLAYSGEEDLLAHYFYNYDTTQNRYRIDTEQSNFDGLMIDQGHWLALCNSQKYQARRNDNEISYFWDDLIRRTCQNKLDGTGGGNDKLFEGKSAIYEMAKEMRLARRVFSSQIADAVVNFPEDGGNVFRRFMPSPISKTGYVFLQTKQDHSLGYGMFPRPVRQKILEISCGAMRNKFEHLEKVVGIAMDAPKFSQTTGGEDFILLECAEWPDGLRAQYEDINKKSDFSGSGEMFRGRTHDFPDMPIQQVMQTARWRKVGRNDPCPCESGKKFKQCCLQRVKI